MSRLPANYKPLYTEKQIAAAISKLGREITAYAEAQDDQVLAMCVLRGGMMFFSDLVRKIDCSVELTLCRAKSYSSEDNAQTKEVKLQFDLDEFQDRRILLIDDICDSGRTLKELEATLIARGAGEVCSAGLVHRNIEGSNFSPTWAGFEFDGEQWLVGYGMEDKNLYANLPAVYTLE